MVYQYVSGPKVSNSENCKNSGHQILTFEFTVIFFSTHRCFENCVFKMDHSCALIHFVIVHVTHFSGIFK